MTLEDLGYKDGFEKYRAANNLDSFEVARVISEHKERYGVKTAEKEYDAEIIGNLRYTASDRADFPAVGDWVAISEYDDGKALIHAVFERQSLIERQAVGKFGEKQIIAANIDFAFIVQAADRDFNVNRIERYLTICHSSKVEPIIIINKIDLLDSASADKLKAQVEKRVANSPVITLSAKTRAGFARLQELILPGKTYCLLGSSGVGKSTLLNSLAGKLLTATGEISSKTNKGKHVTSRRELAVLDGGGVIIDNPGMREVGVADSTGGLVTVFDAIFKLSEKCKFSDCSHTSETGCAVLEAVAAGEIDKKFYDNYMKMQREKEHFESTVAERRKKDKEFGKIVKNFKKMKIRNR